jgi:hypothetical protein
MAWRSNDNRIRCTQAHCQHDERAFLEVADVDQFEMRCASCLTIYTANDFEGTTMLERFTTLLLMGDSRESGDRHNILFESHLANRKKREVPVDPLMIDPAFSKKKQESAAKTSGDGQRMFFRSHPEGRKVNSKEQRRRHGASYYR